MLDKANEAREQTRKEVKKKAEKVVKEINLATLEEDEKCTKVCEKYGTCNQAKCRCCQMW